MLQRVLEPEVMDSPQEAADYDAMDHREVNARFVDDLLAVVAGAPLPKGALPSRTPASSEPDEPDRPWDVLDLGTGTAQIPIVLCQRWECCRVLAVDAAVAMLDLARYNLEIGRASCRERV